MTTRLRIILTTLLLLLATGEAAAQFGGRAGAFTRLGFGARGMGMGNALAAVTSGHTVGLYNPAALPFAERRAAGASFGILALDRKLNSVVYSQPVRPGAGIAAGILNSGVSDIDGRDRDGEATGPLSTDENLAFLSFANRFSSVFSAGLTIKLYHHRLFTDVSATSVGLDLGALLRVTSDLTVAATVRDLNSQYKWDTGTLYGNDGNTTKDLFPVLTTAGAAWLLPDSMGILAAEVEFSNAGTVLSRAGVEVPVIPELTLRAGIDRMDLRDEGAGVRPSFGFTVRRGFGTWEPAVDYAWVIEPFAPTGMHIIGLSVAL